MTQNQTRGVIAAVIGVFALTAGLPAHAKSDWPAAMDLGFRMTAKAYGEAAKIDAAAATGVKATMDRAVDRCGGRGRCAVDAQGKAMEAYWQIGAKTCRGEAAACVASLPPSQRLGDVGMQPEEIAALWSTFLAGAALGAAISTPHVTPHLHRSTRVTITPGYVQRHTWSWSHR